MLKNFFLIFLGLVISFSGFEAALQLGVIPSDDTKYRFCGSPTENYSFKKFNRFHPDYGWTGRPNLTFYRKRTNIDQWNLYTYNSEGFRDRYNSGEKNIIVLGDSFTEGLMADNYSSYPYLLDRWTPNTSFHNYGKGGYGTDQELIIYRNKGKEINHSLVILGYYLGHDMNNNIRNLSLTPQFQVNNGSLELVSKPKNSVRQGSAEEGIIQNPYLQSIQDFLWEKTYSYRFIYKRIKYIDNEDSEHPLPPKKEELKKMKRLTRFLVEGIGEEAEANNAELLILGIPERGDVNPNNPRHYLPSEAEEYWSTQREMLRSISDNNSNIHYLDLEEDLVKADEENSRVYTAVDGHLDDKGYRVIAESTYEKLADMGYVESFRHDKNIRSDDGS